MLFNSYVFIFGFLPLTLIIFFVLTKFGLIKAANVWRSSSYGYKKSVRKNLVEMRQKILMEELIRYVI
ncbi:hypothetical protein [Okeania sp. SIO2B9]|uniref:hypothetical protein n=1 Tax=Okeania sp. SIO2B9 TaxID=2607782 RepID=UPI00257D7434|nr:hypothetical protein [Okeania sp. SIO2B9]